MPNDLATAYQKIEHLFTSFRKRYDHHFQRNETPIIVSNEWRSHPASGRSGGPRAVLSLGNGYVVKVTPYLGVNYIKVKLKPMMSKAQGTQEETNVRTLRSYGFTEERGFLVPDHKVVGLSVEENQVKVDVDGIGVTIADDISEGGLYSIVDIHPSFFYSLDNKEEFLENYKRHIDALLELYHNPKIHATVNRHGKPDNPLESISRMLLAKIKDQKGEIVIGDLDNILFEEVSLL